MLGHEEGELLLPRWHGYGTEGPKEAMLLEYCRCHR